MLFGNNLLPMGAIPWIALRDITDAEASLPKFNS